MKVSFRFQRGRLMIPPVIIDHYLVVEPVMVLDTGCSVTMITPELAAELGIIVADLEPNSKIYSVTGAAATVELTLNRISLLGLSVENVKVLCHPLPPRLELDGILGLNFLRHFNFEINHDTETITLEKCLASSP